MPQEGAVEAVLKLCKTDSLLLRGYCSAVLKHFGATPVLREKLVARGGVSKYFGACRRQKKLNKCGKSSRDRHIP